jgi:hypothetical protein
MRLVEGPAGPYRLAERHHRGQQGQVRDDAVEQPGPELIGEVGHGQEDERAEAEPGHDGQRPARRPAAQAVARATDSGTAENSPG